MASNKIQNTVFFRVTSSNSINPCHTVEAVDEARASAKLCTFADAEPIKIRVIVYWDIEADIKTYERLTVLAGGIAAGKVRNTVKPRYVANEICACPE